LLEAFDARAFREILRRFEDPLLDQVRLDVIRHGKEEASDLTAPLNGKASNPVIPSKVEGIPLRNVQVIRRDPSTSLGMTNLAGARHCVI
jgi:hypothetical protein